MKFATHLKTSACNVYTQQQHEKADCHLSLQHLRTVEIPENAEIGHSSSLVYSCISNRRISTPWEEPYHHTLPPHQPSLTAISPLIHP